VSTVHRKRLLLQELASHGYGTTAVLYSSTGNNSIGRHLSQLNIGCTNDNKCPFTTFLPGTGGTPPNWGSQLVTFAAPESPIGFSFGPVGGQYGPCYYSVSATVADPDPPIPISLSLAIGVQLCQNLQNFDNAFVTGSLTLGVPPTKKPPIDMFLSIFSWNILSVTGGITTSMNDVSCFYDGSGNLQGGTPGNPDDSQLQLLSGAPSVIGSSATNSMCNCLQNLQFRQALFVGVQGPDIPGLILDTPPLSLPVSLIISPLAWGAIQPFLFLTKFQVCLRIAYCLASQI